MLTLLFVMGMLPSKENGVLKFLSPQIIFVVSFIPGVIYAFWYVDKWDLNLSKMTLVTIITGLVVFILASYITNILYKYVFSRIKFFLPSKYTCNKNNDINSRIDRWKIIVLLVLQLISLILTVFFLFRTYGFNLSSSIFMYRSSSTGEDAVALPSMVKLLRRIALSSGYIITYLYLNGIVYKNKKNRLLELICILLAILNGFMLGGRGDGIQIIIAAIVQYIALKVYSSNQKRILPVKDVLKVIIILAIIVASFTQLGELLGRKMDFLNYNDYIAVYLSAELKNLDIFISSGSYGHPISKSLTLYSIINSLGGILHQPQWIHDFDIPFRYYGGYALGNVGTIFYPFFYDGGLMGVIIYTSFMAFFCQIGYMKFVEADKKSQLNLMFIFYSYLAYIIVFSFFSNKFYEMIFNTSFIWCVVSWVLVKYFLMRIKVKV